MRTGTIAFMMGIVAAQQCSQLPPTTWLLSIPACLFGLYYARPWLKPFFALLIGFFWVFAYIALFQPEVFPVEFEGRDLLVEGTVTSIPRVSARSSRFDFETRLDNKDYRFRLSWYEKASRPPRAGETWRLRVKLKRPHGLMNPGGFDYERSLFRHAIAATGYVRRDDINQPITPPARLPTLNTSIARWRQGLSDALRDKLKDSPHAGLVEALAIGNRHKITSQEWDILTATGTIHLVAISGLHIGLVAGFAFLLIRLVVSRSTWLMRLSPVQVPAAAGAILAALTYALLAGLSLPTLRAFLMVCIVMISLIQRRTIRASNVIAVSLLLILMVDPMSVLDVGFWLSFGAVAIILFSVTGRIKNISSLASWGKIQFVIAIGMLPLMLIFFQRISVAAPLANLLAVPWVSFVTVPTTLLGTLTMDVAPSLSSWLLEMATGSIELLWFFLKWINTLPWSVIETHAPVGWTLVPAMIGAVYLLMPRGLPARWLAIFLFLPAVFITQPTPAEGELRLTLIDVGQGLSLLLQTRQHSLLYDTGPRYPSGFDAGKNIVVPFLKSQGILRLDAMVVSHGDNDHSGGANAVLQLMPVSQLYSGAAPRRWHNDMAMACTAGHTWNWDGVSFRMLHPAPEQGRGGNNRSCVIQVSVGLHSILLPGDIERQAEMELVARYGDQLKSDLLVAPHHGSKTSSWQAFIDQVSPRLVLVANGYRNRYRFPNQVVTQRYTRAGISWFETADSGAISLSMTANGLTKPVFWRDELRRYWHTR